METFLLISMLWVEQLFLLGAAPLGGLGVLIGLAMYLPFSITLGYLIGCLISMYLLKKHGVSFYENNCSSLSGSNRRRSPDGCGAYPL